MTGLNEKPFAAFKGKTGESIKATYTDEISLEDAQKFLALKDLRDSLKRTLQVTGHIDTSPTPLNESDTDQEEPEQLLEEVKHLMGIVESQARERIGYLDSKKIVPASEQAEERLNILLQDNDTRVRIVNMLLEGKTSRDVCWMLEKEISERRKHDENFWGGLPLIGRAVGNRFAYRNRVVEFIRTNRPETTDQELEHIYSKRDAHE